MSLECVSCKAQSVYEVSKSSYVYLEGTCQNCHNDSKLGVKSPATLVFASPLVDFREESEGGRGGKICVRNKVLDLNCHRDKEGKQPLTVNAVAGWVWPRG